MSKKKILFRNRSLEVGGIENVLLTIFNNLDRSKFEIILLLNYEQGEFLNRLPNHVKLLTVGKGNSQFSKNKIIQTFQKTIRRLKYFIFQKYPKSFYIKNDLMDTDYEIAFSHYMVGDVLNSPNKTSEKIFWIHSDLTNSGLNSNKSLILINNLLKFNKGVFVSNYSKKIVEKTWNIELNNSIVIHNPIEINEIIKKSNENIEEQYKNIDFISVGRLFWQKGFMDLVKASAKLKSDGYNFKVLLLGNGSQKQQLEEEIQKNNLQEVVVLYGHANNPYKFINNSKYFILPSYSEGYPLVLVEALTLGKYVLSTNVGGIPDIINNNNGIIFSPGIDNLYIHMKKVLDNSPVIDINDNKKLFIEKNKLIFNQIESLLN